MADSLYVCRFSNGHIKVGRSVDPKSRIVAHADRVACMGVELVDHFIVSCGGIPASREAMLISRCREAAQRRHKNEWFVGLDYLGVCEWAKEAAATEFNSATGGTPAPESWSGVITDLRNAGLTQMDIAAECGCDQSTISDLLNGVAREPRYSLGSKLIALHGGLVPTHA